MYGGERGIRTLGTLLTYTRFPGVLLQPLGHLSVRRRYIIYAVGIVKRILQGIQMGTPDRQIPIAGPGAREVHSTCQLVRPGALFPHDDRLQERLLLLLLQQLLDDDGADGEKLLLERLGVSHQEPRPGVAPDVR